MTPTPTPFINPTIFPAARFANIGIIMNILTPIIMIISALLIGGMFLVAGYTFLTAGDDAEQVKKAQSTATYAALGALIVSLAYLLVKLLSFILGINSIPL